MSVDTKLTWNGEAVKRDFDKAKFKSLYESAAIVEGSAVALAPVGKKFGGTLKQSISKIVTAVKGVVFTPVDYAPHVEFGTRPHKITATGRGLSDGKNFFGKTVNHPGTSEQPFMRPALFDNVKKIISIFKKNGIDLKWVRR